MKPASAPIDVGSMRHRLAVLYPAETPNSFGERGQLWALQGIVSASVDPISAMKPWVAEQADPQTTHMIGIRYYAGLNAKFRLAKSGQQLTTIALAVGTGLQTVAPGSMAGIVQGCVLWIGSEANADTDVVAVAAVASGTFAGTFGSAHAGGVNVSAARTFKLLKVLLPDEIKHRVRIEAVEETLGTP
jgi:head-tail adaptor